MDKIKRTIRPLVRQCEELYNEDSRNENYHMHVNEEDEEVTFRNGTLSQKTRPIELVLLINTCNNI